MKKYKVGDSMSDTDWKLYQKGEFKNEVYIVDGTDVLNYVTKSSTLKQRRKFDIGDIYINAAVCRECGDYIRSKHRHSFISCKCGRVSVDGGSWYARRLYKKPTDYIDVVEYFYDSV